jgi:hypothetical protein
MRIHTEDLQVRIEANIEGVWCYLDIEDGGANWYAETRNGLDHDEIPEDAWEFSKTLTIDLTTPFWQAVASELDCEPTLDALFEYTA